MDRIKWDSDEELRKKEKEEDKQKFASRLNRLRGFAEENAISLDQAIAIEQTSTLYSIDHELGQIAKYLDLSQNYLYEIKRSQPQT